MTRLARVVAALCVLPWIAAVSSAANPPRFVVTYGPGLAETPSSQDQPSREIAGRRALIGSGALMRAALARLKTAWPAPMPPEAPVLHVEEVAGLIADITSDAAGM